YSSSKGRRDGWEHMQRLSLSFFGSVCRIIAQLVLPFTLLVIPALVRAQDRNPLQLADEIAKLEQAIARYEAGETRKRDPTKEMQHLVSMAKLATLYIQADRAPDSWPLSEKILARVERMFGPDHPNIVSQLEATAAAYGLQGRYADAEKL